MKSKKVFNFIVVIVCSISILVTGSVLSLKKQNKNKNLALEKFENEKVRVMIELKGGTSLENPKDEKNIEKEQKNLINKLKKLKNLEIKRTFTYSVNAISVDVSRNKINNIKKLTGVKNAYEAEKFTPKMNFSKELTKANEVFNGYKLKGEGTVIAVLDSGIDVNHKDMKINNPEKCKLKKSMVQNIIKEKNLQGKYYTDKVPYAFNYADENDEIKDINKSTDMHGMHVAGIIAANGDEKEIKEQKAIKGVAPEGQIIDMKIFSNKRKNSVVTEDTIIAAIEDSIKLKADVINLSLGISGGFSDESFTVEYKAIKTAMDRGILVNAAAGNEAYTTYPVKKTGVEGGGTISTPGIFKDTICVAASDNSKLMMQKLKYKYDGLENEVPYTYSNVNPTIGQETINQNKEKEIIGKIDGDFEVLDAGYGTKKEIYALANECQKKYEETLSKEQNKIEKHKLTEKILLIKRGKSTYTFMKRWATINKAKGIIIYNSDGNDNLENMDRDIEDLPAVFISNSAGKNIKKVLKEGKSVKVSFPKGEKITDNSSKNDMYGYSSWGPGPFLEFKPEITAPGANIFSTVNDNNYRYMHGTSMATPHVSGVEALVVQSLNKETINLKGRELSEFIKMNLINTANPLFEKGEKSSIPFSPRRQGAGLVQANKAVKNRTIIYDKNGFATVALKEIKNNEIKFELNVENKGKEKVEYNLSELEGIFTEEAKDVDLEHSKWNRGLPQDVKIKGASISFDKNTVIVNPNSKEKLIVKINIPKDFKRQQFIEGFIKFKSINEEKTPSLVVPYMGFYGDWGKLPIIDKPMWEKESITKKTALIDLALNSLGQSFGIIDDYELGYTGEQENIINPKFISISPNGDGNMDVMVPRIYFLRGAKEVTAEILDEKKRVIRHIGKVKYCRATKSPLKLRELMWDAVISSQGDMAKDGQYYIRIRASALGDDKKEETIMPIKIDTTPPKAEIISNEKSTGEKGYIIKWKMEDTESGLFNPCDKYGGMNIGINLNGEYNDEQPIMYDEDSKIYSSYVELKPGSNSIQLIVTNNSGLVTLLNKEIHLNEVGLKVLSKEVNNNKISIKTEVKNSSYSEEKKNLKFLAVAYDENNSMVDKKEVEFSLKANEEDLDKNNIEVNFENANKINSVKFMIWKDKDSMKPLCDSQEIKIK